MTDEELATIEARCEVATPGPWGWLGNFGIGSKPMKELYDAARQKLPDNLSDDDLAELPEPIVAVVPTAWGRAATKQGEQDATFIGACREDVPALIAEIRRLRAIAQ